MGWQVPHYRRRPDPMRNAEFRISLNLLGIGAGGAKGSVFGLRLAQNWVGGVETTVCGRRCLEPACHLERRHIGGLTSRGSSAAG